MDKFYAAVAGGVVMLFLTPMIYPLSKRLEVLSRRIYRIKPVSVYVDRDTSIIWAGFPRWVGASVWLPDFPETAPEDPVDWHSWAVCQGGADAYVTVLKVTISSRELATVVVDPPKVRRETLWIGDPPKGVVATNPVGGAAIDPRRIQINLEMGSAMWINPHGEPIDALGVTLASGDVEQFYIYAVAEQGGYLWRLQLPILVDGKREVLTIDDGGKPFITYGMEGFEEKLWIGEKWLKREDC
ncbi:hypothetical protein [Streptomyces rubiginosohelvolus]|uniref:hypothetical protein n=1 Tax=Streptomyces rubiginosohelvolus TaxID=67362 RepID=UPI0035DF1256